MTRLEVKLLGRMSCELPGGQQLKLATRKSEALLAYLAMAPGQDYARDRLVNLFWSDRGEDQARNSLRHALSSLKKSLDAELPDLLVIERATVRLNPGLISVDVNDFRLLANSSEFDDLVSASELFRGEFLEGLLIRDPAGELWINNERCELNRVFVNLLGQIGNLQVERSDFKSAIDSAERLVSIDPLEEPGWRLLMMANHRNGNRNHALMAYKRCCDILQRELGVEAEAETFDLWQKIRLGQAPDTVKADGNEQRKGETYKFPVDKLSTEEHSIAVFPFDNLSGGPEQEYFSDGITESIILNLSLFPGLNVKSRNSSFAFKQQIKTLGEISKELNVDYVVEGSIRRASERIRITVQLIEASSGNQIWGKRYDSELSDLFDLEEELSRTIAATVTGQIESDIQRIALLKSASDQRSYDLLLSGKYHCYKFTRRDILIAQDKFEACLALDPENVQAHALLYECHILNWMERWVVDYEHAFKLAGEFIHKALELDPEVVMVQRYFAEYLIFCRENEAAARCLDKVLSINPNDPDALATKAFNLNAIGEYELALKISKNCQQLDPSNPWVNWIVAESQLFTGKPEQAKETIINSKTSISYLKALLVVAYSFAGDKARAREVMQQFLQLCRDDMLSMPSNTEEWSKYWSDNLPYRDINLVETLIACLMEAGLCDQGEEVRDNIPSILVLPFENMSGDSDQEYFSDGLTETIILALSAAKGLNVKSRHTSFAYKNSPLSLNNIGEELDIQYVVEGSIRKSSDQVRITVQLGEVSSGNQIWGKRYDRPLAQIFELEEELVNTIVGTISGRIGHEIRVSSVHKPARNLKSFDYLAQGNYHLERLSSNGEVSLAKDMFHKCLEIDADSSDAHTGLAIAIFVELFENWAVDRRAAKALAQQHIQAALNLEPDNALTHAYLSEFQLFTRDFELGLYHADRSIELGPHIPDGYAIKAYLLSITGKRKEALELADISMRIDPHHYYMGWNAGEAYRICGEFQKSMDTFRAIPHPSPSLHAEMAACLVGLGQLDRAKVEMQNYRKLAREQMVRFPDSVEDWGHYWHENVPYQIDDEFKLFFDQLLQAGLCDEDSGI